MWKFTYARSASPPDDLDRGVGQLGLQVRLSAPAERSRRHEAGLARVQQRLHPLKRGGLLDGLVVGAHDAKVGRRVRADDGAVGRDLDVSFVRVLDVQPPLVGGPLHPRRGEGVTHRYRLQ